MNPLSCLEGQTVADIGEFGLIDRISSIVGVGDAILGIGDDAAVIDLPGSHYLLVTVDMLVEDVHFRTGMSNARDIGRRLLEVSASDIASMGGTPMLALTSIALPESTPVSLVDDIFEGLKAALQRHGASLVGGNTTRTTGPLILDLTLLGSVLKNDLVRRSGARAGDVLAVTGSLGDATASRLIVERGILGVDPTMTEWISSHAAPEARVQEGQALGAAHLIHAMIDISDGVAGDIQHLCRASRVGAMVEESKLPLSVQLCRAAEMLGERAESIALSGGEDYELLIALPMENVTRAQSLMESPITVIGQCVPECDGVQIRYTGGRELPLTPTGWSHF